MCVFWGHLAQRKFLRLTAQVYLMGYTSHTRRNMAQCVLYVHYPPVNGEGQHAILSHMRVGLFCFLFFFAALFPLPSRAQVPFGGLAVSMTICTCAYTAAAYPYMITFAPFWTGGKPSANVSLAVPTVLAFLHYKIRPGAWSLGFFTPGVQGCWQQAGYACKPQAGQSGAITPPFAGFAGSSP